MIHIYTLKMYCGSENRKGGLASSKVVISLMDKLLDSRSTVFTDNYYTSVSLAARLLKRETHLVGTVRSNRKINAKDVLSIKLQTYEVFGQ